MSNNYAGGIKANATSVVLPIELRQDGGGTNPGDVLTGITYTGVTIKYRRQGANSDTSITLSAGTLGTWSSGGFVESSNGMYELGIPNAAIASGVDFVEIKVSGVSNCLGRNYVIPLGVVGIDWSNVINQGSTVALTGTTTNDLATALSDLSAVPGATATVLQALNLLYELARNKITQTGTNLTLFKDDSSTPVGSQTVSDDSTTFTRTKMT
jgi:hypothetical protein